MMRRHLLSSASVCVLLCVPFFALAQTAGDTSDTSDSGSASVQAQINSNNAQIAELDKEIAQYQTQLDATTEQKNTLQNQINQLNLQSKQLTAKISVTKSQIKTTQLQITQLSSGISAKQASIIDEQSGLADSIRVLNQVDQIPLAVTLIGADTITDAWSDVDAIDTIQGAVQDNIKKLSSDKQSLTDTKTQAEQKQQQLTSQQQTLASQQGSLAATTKAQNDLLAQTKSKESTYQAIIAQKKAQEDDLQQALTDLQSQYNQNANPDSYPDPTPGLLHWPLSSVRITQYFGNTPFATANSALYRGNGHDGIDIAAAIGTPVHAALAGTILATGNTDAVKGCYSFGKWIMIKHGNGLNTMYGHLSEIDVTQGEKVATGQLIGYSGETGYATGPHLHFGVYVSSVTQIIPLGQATKAVTPCAKAVMPVPPVTGYLNPLNYLPSI